MMSIIRGFGLSFLFTLALTLVMLAVPFSVNAGGGSQAASGTSGETTLNVLTYDDDFWGRFVDDFMANTPGIKVNRKLSQAVDTGAIQVLLSSNDAPDVLMVNSGPGRVLPLAKAGMLMDLTDYYTSRGWREKTVPYVLDALKNFDSRIYEVVDYIDVFQVYYNKDLFAKAGVRPPAAWNELITVCEGLKAAGIQPFVIGATDNFMLGWFAGNLFQSAGGFSLMTDVIYGNKSWDSPEIIRAYDTLIDFVNKGYINSDAAAINSDEARTRHAVGQAAMAIIGNNYLKTYVDQGMCKFETFGTFMIPSMIGGRATPTGGLAQSWIVNKNTKKLDACLAFLDYTYGKKIDFLIKDDSGMAPAALIPPGKQLNADSQAAANAVAGGAGYNPSVFVTAGVKTVYYESNQAAITKLKNSRQIVEAIQAAKAADTAAAR
jgi:raffinose/stachyose/melibiose transport system substrate-binding protein